MTSINMSYLTQTMNTCTNGVKFSPYADSSPDNYMCMVSEYACCLLGREWTNYTLLVSQSELSSESTFDIIQIDIIIVMVTVIKPWTLQSRNRCLELLVHRHPHYRPDQWVHRQFVNMRQSS